MHEEGNTFHCLYHFPILHPGGCFYDILARFHDQSGHISHRNTSLELFGKCPDLRPSVILPYRAQMICHWLGPESNISPEELRDHYSAWQYLHLYSAFSNRSLEPIFQAETRPGRKRQSEMIRSVCSGLTHLRFCPLCLIKDFLTEKEPYWHQVHQIYGVKYCPQHEVPLINSTVTIERRLMRYITLSSLFPDENLIGQANRCITHPTGPYRHAYLRLARTIDLLLCRGKELGTGEKLERRYLDAIAPETQSLQRKQITTIMADFAGMAFLKDLYRQDLDDRLNMIERKGLRSMSPLDHALVIAAIGDVF